MKNCFLLKRDIIIVYIFPVFGGKWENYGKRFAKCYKTFKPVTDHRLIVVSNGGKPTKRMLETFGEIDCQWFVHDNSGYDIGAYQNVCSKNPCELMIFFGSSSYFRRSGWLERMVEASDKHGVALYGAMGHRGDLKNRIWPHLRTTGFWCAPELLNAYPHRIVAVSRRYEFEHGITSFAEWVKSMNYARWMVTFDGEYLWDDWNKVKNGYHRGNQSNLLCGDRLTEPPFYPIP